MGRSNKNTLKKTLSTSSYMAGPVDGLPEGWKVETKIRESGNHAENKYKYYTDPGTGYVFRSKKDALHYVKTGVLGKYAFKPKERRTNNVKEGDITTLNGHHSTGKGSNSDELVNDKSVFVGQCSKSDEAVNDEPKLDAKVSKPDEAVNGESAVESSAIGGGDMELSRPFPLKKKSSKKRKGKKATFAKVESQSVENGVEEHKRRKTQVGSKKHKKLELNTPQRVSKRLAGIAAEVVAVMERPSGTPQVDAVGQPPEAMLAVNSTGPDAKLASEMKRTDVTPLVEAEKQPPEAKLAVSSTGTNGELTRLFLLNKKSSKKRKGKKATFAKVESQSAKNGVKEHKRRKTQVGSKKRKKLELYTPRRVSKRLAGISAEVVAVVERPSGTPHVDVGQTPEAMLAVNSTGPDAKLASEMKRPDVTPHLEAEKQPPEAKLAVNYTGTNGEPASDLEGPDTTQAASVEPPSRAMLAVNYTGTNGELALDLEGSDTTPAASVEPPSGAMLAVSHTSVDSARLVSAQFYQFEPTKAGNWAADPLTDEIFYKQVGSQVKEVTATTWASGGEGYPEQGTSDTRREEQTIQSQPLLDHVTPGEFDIKTQADGNLEDPLELPFAEWPDSCLEFAYKTLDAGKVGTISNTNPMSDPCIEFAYKILTGAIPVEYNTSTACPDVIPMSDPCTEFAYKTLPGAISVENTPPGTFTNAIPTSDPCIEFDYRTLTGGVPVETPAIVENSQAVPGSIPLSDPCLEFAYTTLIGAIPLEESWAVQGYLQQQSSAQTQSDNLVDGFFGTVVEPTSLNKLQNDSAGASPNESLHFFSNQVVQLPNRDGEMDSKRR